MRQVLLPMHAHFGGSHTESIAGHKDTLEKGWCSGVPTTAELQFPAKLHHAIAAKLDLTSAEDRAFFTGTKQTRLLMAL